MNAQAKKPLPRWLPLVVGACLVAFFAGLGAWQISRGLDKRAQQAAYRDETGFMEWHDGVAVRPFQRIRVTGHYDGERQFLLENIIVNSRYGYYVVTPLRGRADEPVLLVNRGWIEKTGDEIDAGLLQVPAGRITVRGRAGSLPRAGMQMGDPVTPGSGWPKRAVYPGPEDVSAALGEEVQPFVLLMDHEEANGFRRHWVPSEFGPGKHFGYALQWFAMAAVLSGLLAWNYRKKRFDQ